MNLSNTLSSTAWLAQLASGVALLSCQAAWAQDTKLTGLSLEQLLDVRIFGASKYEQKQNQTAAAVSVITRDEIKTFGWRSLAEALASLPGIHTTYDRQYTDLGTRGFGLPGDLNTRVLVMINGNRVNDPVYDAGVAGREFPLDLDLIDRIEFIPGPGGAVYGQNAMFGVVNVITRTGASVDGVEVAVSAQMPQVQSEGRFSWGQKLANGLDILVSASGLHARGADRFFDFPTTGISGIAHGLDAEQLGQFYASVSKGAWSLELVQGNRRKYDPAAAFFSDPLVPGAYQGDHFSLVQAQYQNRFAQDTVQVTGRIFAGEYRYRSEAIFSTLLESRAHGDWVGTEWRALVTTDSGQKLMLGIEAQRDSRVELTQFDALDPTRNFRVSKTAERVGVFAQGEWALSESWAATLGLRVDRNNRTGVSYSPRAALIWQASPATTVKALVGRAHRAPNTFESDVDDGVSQVPNFNLNIETIDTLELVADHQVNPDFRLRASAYQWDLKNLITLGQDPASGLSQYQSGAPVKARGLELGIDQAWRNGARLRTSLSVQDVSAESSTFGGQLVNSPKLLGKLHFSSPIAWSLIPGLRLGYELMYDSKRLSLNGTELGDYAVSNLILSTDKLAKGLSLSMGLYNLFDKRYDHPASEINWQNALAQDERSVRIKLSYRF